MIEIIPAIDIIDGKCVRLTEGDYGKVTTYREDPLEMAIKYESVGIRRLHLVDLDGARTGQLQNIIILEAIASKTRLRVDFGGGISTDEALKSVFDAGAAFATVGSVVVKNPGLFQSWIANYDASRFFIGADIRNEKIAINGWTHQTDIGVIDFVQTQMSRRVHYFFCTDISKDGKLEGPAEEMYRRIIAQCPGVRLVASGGIASVSDLQRMEEIGCAGVIIGKAIYENRISLKELAKFNSRSV